MGRRQSTAIARSHMSRRGHTHKTRKVSFRTTSAHRQNRLNKGRGCTVALLRLCQLGIVLVSTLRANGTTMLSTLARSSSSSSDSACDVKADEDDDDDDDDDEDDARAAACLAALSALAVRS